MLDGVAKTLALTRVVSNKIEPLIADIVKRIAALEKRVIAVEKKLGVT